MAVLLSNNNDYAIEYFSQFFDRFVRHKSWQIFFTFSWSKRSFVRRTFKTFCRFFFPEFSFWKLMSTTLFVKKKYVTCETCNFKKKKWKDKKYFDFRKKIPIKNVWTSFDRYSFLRENQEEILPPLKLRLNALT